MRYYCTKYVLTEGIIEFDGDLQPREKEYVVQKSTGHTFGLFVKLGKDAFMTLEAAKEDALARARKNVSAKEKALVKANKTLLSMQRGDFKVVRR